MRWDGIERRQSLCPICATHRARAVTTTEGAGRKTLEYECQQCGFQWRVEYDATPAPNQEDDFKEWLE
jgi:hypothetical protein